MLVNKASVPMSKSFLALLLVLWARYPIWEYISGAFSYLPGFGSLGETSIGIIIGLLAIFSLKEIMRCIKSQDMAFIIIVIAIYFTSYALHPENQFVLDEKYTRVFLLTVLPYYFVGLLVNVEKCKEYFLYVSYISILAQFIYIFIMNKGGVRDNESDNMIVYAYNILPHVTYVTYWLFEKRTLSSLVFFMLGFLLQISMANRGSIVCLITFVVLFFIVMRFFERKKTTSFTVIIVGVLAVIFFQPLTLALYDLMGKFGLNTRVLDYIFSENFTQSEGRIEIAETIMGAIKEDPLKTHGIGGENQLNIIYSHNLLLEWWFAFGVIFGSLLMLALVFLIIKAFRRATGVSRFFLLLLITSGLEGLFLSGTYLTTPLFFMLIGYSVNCIRNSKFVPATSLHAVQS